MQPHECHALAMTWRNVNCCFHSLMLMSVMVIRIILESVRLSTPFSWTNEVVSF